MLDGEVIQNMMFQFFSGQKSCTLNKQMKMIIIVTRYVITLKTPENNYSKSIYIDDSVDANMESENYKF